MQACAVVGFLDLNNIVSDAVVYYSAAAQNNRNLIRVKKENVVVNVVPDLRVPDCDAFVILMAARHVCCCGRPCFGLLVACCGKRLAFNAASMDQ